MRSKTRRGSPEDELLIALVRGDPLRDLYPACDVGKLRESASRHLLSATLASELLAQGIGSGDSPRWAAAALLSSERDAALYAASLSRIRTLFASKGLPTIVLKGISLALGEPRDTGDIDLLLPEPALVGAIGLLESAGYAYVGGSRNLRIRASEDGNWLELMKWANQFEFQDPETGALIELHIAFFERERAYALDFSALDAAMEDIIGACRPDPGSGCLFLSMEDRVLLLALHASVKRAPYNHAFVLRHIRDFDRLMAIGFDWNVLIERAERRLVLPHLSFLVGAYRKFLGGEIPGTAVDRIESALTGPERALVRLHLGCVKDLHRRFYFSALLYRYLLPFVLPSTRAAKAKSLLIFPLLFPEPWRLAINYGLPPTAPIRFLLYVLEPFRWVMLIVKNGRR
jgi:hypothetical protein